jgi:hypothetical protein
MKKGNIAKEIHFRLDRPMAVRKFNRLFWVVAKWKGKQRLVFY